MRASLKTSLIPPGVGQPRSGGRLPPPAEVSFPCLPDLLQPLVLRPQAVHLAIFSQLYFDRFSFSLLLVAISLDLSISSYYFFVHDDSTVRDGDWSPGRGLFLR